MDRSVNRRRFLVSTVSAVTLGNAGCMRNRNDDQGTVTSTESQSPSGTSTPNDGSNDGLDEDGVSADGFQFRWEDVQVAYECPQYDSAVEDRYCVDPEIVPLHDGDFRIYMEKFGTGKLHTARSSDGVTWSHEAELSGTFGAFPDLVALPDGNYRMYYEGSDGIKSARSPDGIEWSHESGYRIQTGGHQDLDEKGVHDTTTIRRSDGTYLMVYRTTDDEKYAPDAPDEQLLLWWATSDDGLAFEKQGMAFDARKDEFEGSAFGPDLVERDGSIYLYFWSHRGVYAIELNGDSWESKPSHVMGMSAESFADFGEPQRATDPTLTVIDDRLYMYFAINDKNVWFVPERT